MQKKAADGSTEVETKATVAMVASGTMYRPQDSPLGTAPAVEPSSLHKVGTKPESMNRNGDASAAGVRVQHHVRLRLRLYLRLRRALVDFVVLGFSHRHIGQLSR